jgi:hypothetical protein
MRRDPVQLAQHFLASGFFADVTDLSKAVVKIVAGEELGLGPMAAMRGIYIIEGKPSLSSNLMAALVKRSPAYDYRVTEHTGEKCVISFLQDGKEVGTSEFTIAQAREIKTKEGGKWIPLADTARWKQYPKAMLFARALSQGVRWYCPDLMSGAPAYTPEELGAMVNAQGEVVHVPAEVEVEKPTKLDDARVAHLVEGIEIVKPALAENGADWIDGFNVMLGSLGIDGFEPADDLTAQLSNLSEDDADKIDQALQALADEEAEKAEAAS